MQFQPAPVASAPCQNAVLSEAEVDAYVRGSSEERSTFAALHEPRPSNFLLRRAQALMDRGPAVYPPPRPFLEVAPAGAKGLGLFNRGPPILEGEYIGYYCGRIVFAEDPNSHFRMCVAPDTKIYIEGEGSAYLSNTGDDCVKYINSIDIWKDVPFGGANVQFYPRYPAWPYVYAYATTTIGTNEELLADYRWFDSVSGGKPCHPKCQKFKKGARPTKLDLPPA